jgi:hypothetical protein
VSREGFPLELVGVAGRIKDPDLERVITTSSNEPSVPTRVGTRTARHNRPGSRSRRPRDRIHPQPVSREKGTLRLGAVIPELQDANLAIGTGTSQQAAGLVRGPGDGVDAGFVQGEVEDARPGRCGRARGLLGGGLLAPDEDLAVVAGRGEDVAVFGVGPRDAPDCALVAFEGLD